MARCPWKFPGGHHGGVSLIHQGMANDSRASIQCSIRLIIMVYNNDSSDEQFEDEDYTSIYEECQSILREWSADQPAKAIHVEGILLVV